MPIRFQDETRRGVRVVHLSGSWTAGPDDDPLREQYRQWIEKGERAFVMDLSGLDLLNSIGLGKLVSYYTTLAREGGRVALAGLTERNRRAAYVARILDLFDEFEDVDAAVDAVAPASDD